MNKKSPSPEDIQSAIIEMVADSLSRKEIVSKLTETFGTSQATAYRWVEKYGIPNNTIANGTPVADLVCGSLARLLLAAEDAGDSESVERLAGSLATAAARLKVSHIQL
jgi:hypothetical protein